MAVGGLALTGCKDTANAGSSHTGAKSKSKSKSSKATGGSQHKSGGKKNCDSAFPGKKLTVLKASALEKPSGGGPEAGEIGANSTLTTQDGHLYCDKSGGGDPDNSWEIHPTGPKKKLLLNRDATVKASYPFTDAGPGGEKINYKTFVKKFRTLQKQGKTKGLAFTYKTSNGPNGTYLSKLEQIGRS